MEVVAIDMVRHLRHRQLEAWIEAHVTGHDETVIIHLDEDDIKRFIRLVIERDETILRVTLAD